MDIKERLDYMKLLLAGGDEEEFIKKYQPKTLFKYRAGSEKNENGTLYDIHALNNEYTWQPNVFSLNDPFDCAIRLQWDEKYDSRLEIVKESIEHLTPDEINKAFKSMEIEYKNHWHITSFSEKVDSILMWSHYANQHRGFCIEYNTNEFKSKFFPVIYSNNFLNSFENLNAASVSILTKAFDWNYELEWRIINRTEGFCYSSGFCYPTPSPVALYLGCRIDENKELKDLLIEYAKNKKIVVYQMKLKHDAYELEQVVLHDFRV